MGNQSRGAISRIVMYFFLPLDRCSSVALEPHLGPTPFTNCFTGWRSLLGKLLQIVFEYLCFSKCRILFNVYDSEFPCSEQENNSVSGKKKVSWATLFYKNQTMCFNLLSVVFDCWPFFSHLFPLFIKEILLLFGGILFVCLFVEASEKKTLIDKWK